METWFGLGGYPLLFLVSAAASSLLPLGSEWLLILQLLDGADPFAAVLVASAGNLLGALTTYGIGLKGGTWLVDRLLKIRPERREKAEKLFSRYGVWSLLFSWLPVIGDPLCFVGGVLRVSLIRFSLLAGAGKTARYAAVAWLTLSGSSLRSI